MARILEGCKALCFLAVTFAAITLGVVGLHLNVTASNLNALSGQLGSSVTKLNAVLDETHRGVNEISLASREARLASHDQRQYLEMEVPDLFADVHKAVGDTRAVLQSANDSVTAFTGHQSEIAHHATALLDEGQRSVASVQPVTLEAEMALHQTRTTIDSLQSLLLAPVHEVLVGQDVQQSLHHMNEISASGAHTTANVAIASDSLTHPHRIGKLFRWLW